MDPIEKDELKKEASEGSMAAMERTLLEEYLQKKGYHLRDLCTLPEDEIKALMTEACQYASLKMAQIESSSHFREHIRWPG